MGVDVSDHAIYPVIITYDRYSGVYSGARWTAFNAYEVPSGPADDDASASNFWDSPGMPVGKGSTPDEALASLIDSMAKWPSPSLR
jgi:hypothetical protein